MNQYVRVVQVGTLADFRVEVEEGTEGVPLVRLNLTGRAIPGNFPLKRVALDLFGVNVAGEIVWLHYGQRVWDPPFGTRDESVRAGMERMHDLVRAHLDGLGYRVLSGQYGVPDGIRPLQGVFECVRWVKEGEEKYRVEAVEGGGDAD